MGFDFRELVALSGAHTLGSKGFGKPFSFDNAYYKDMLSKPWLDTVSNNGMNIHIGIESDHKLAEDADARAICAEYAEDEKRFFADFAAAFLRVGETGAIWT
jgi:L-ascorbate peroxidase